MVYYNIYDQSTQDNSLTVFEAVRFHMKSFYNIDFQPVFVLKATWFKVPAYGSLHESEVCIDASFFAFGFVLIYFTVKYLTFLRKTWFYYLNMSLDVSVCHIVKIVVKNVA